MGVRKLSHQIKIIKAAVQWHTCDPSTGNWKQEE